VSRVMKMQTINIVER